MMTSAAFETTRFGRLEYSAEDVVSFDNGLLGFEDCTKYVLIQHKEGSPFRWIQSLEKGELAFLVVDPGVYVPDYGPEMPLSLARELSLEEETPRLVYTIVTIPQGRPEDMTLNLAGPLLINAECGKAKQVVLDTEAYPTKFRVFAEKAKDGTAA